LGQYGFLQSSSMHPSEFLAAGLVYSALKVALTTA
jgi:hypothetical protein